MSNPLLTPDVTVVDGMEGFTPDMVRPTEKYKWPEGQIVECFKSLDTYPNMSKVRQFQRHTESMEECVQWAVNSIHNDDDEAERALSHGTGA